MEKCFPHGIDITAPGGIDQLMDFHRLTFGNAQMNANTGAPAGGEGDEGGQGPAPASEPQTPASVEPDESKLGDAGKAALKVERDARSAAEKRAAEAEAKLQKIEDDKLSDIDKAKKEAADRETENAELRTANARLTALAAHPVPAEYQDLVTGTDEASFLASAKKISELYAKAEGKPFKPAPDPSQGPRQTAKVSGWDSGKAEAQKRFGK